MIEGSKYLYKYRHFLHLGYKDHRRLLTNNELFFPSPDKFNDPFDSNFPFHYEDFTRDEFINYWISRMEDGYVKGQHAEIKEKIEILYRKRATPEGKKEILKIQEDILNELRSNKIGIYSMSANCNSILSWGHYSDSHKGFCVGFYKEKLTEFIKSNESLDLGRVEYTEKYPLINVYKSSEEEKITKLFWTKSMDWKYEEEYRIIWYDVANKTLQIDNGIIKRVILGCQISQENKGVITEMLKTRYENISLFQAVKKDNSFGLDFEKLEY
jgi:hypothetical protein